MQITNDSQLEAAENLCRPSIIVRASESISLMLASSSIIIMFGIGSPRLFYYYSTVLQVFQVVWVNIILGIQKRSTRYKLSPL